MFGVTLATLAAAFSVGATNVFDWANFDAWVTQVRGGGSALDDAGYAALAKPSKAVPPTSYRSVEPNMFERIIDQTTAGPEKAGTGAAWCPPVQQAGG